MPKPGDGVGGGLGVSCVCARQPGAATFCARHGIALRTNDIYRRMAGPSMSNMLQGAGTPPEDAPAPVGGAGRGRQAAAERQDAADAKLIAAVEAERAYWAKRGPIEHQKMHQKMQLEARLEARLEAQLEAQLEENRKYRLEYNHNHMIEVDEDSDRTTLIDIEWYDAGATGDVYLPGAHARSGVKPSPITPEESSRPSERARVRRKGSCACDCCATRSAADILAP